jgi:DNA processing protein
MHDVDPAVLVGLALTLPHARGLVAELRARLRVRSVEWKDLPDLVARFARPSRSRLCLDRLHVRVARALARARQCQMRLLDCTRPEYPPLLLQLPDPPVVLWVSGMPTALVQPAIAVVGARAASWAALETARRTSRDLSAAGLTIVSGLARGVDASAHLGALETGRTVAVLGCGLDVCYPPEHHGLAVRIAVDGAVMTEFPPGTPARGWQFPLRNRLVAGLALATVVVEAGPASGALITAREALDQGKDVLVVPGMALDGRNRGGHGLIKDGAGLVEDAADILDVLRGGPWSTSLALATRTLHRDPPRLAADAGKVDGTGRPRRWAPKTTSSSLTGARTTEGLPGSWRAGEELDLDDLLELTGLDSATLLARLLEWELDGAIARTPAGRFVRLSR